MPKRRIFHRKHFVDRINKTIFTHTFFNFFLVRKEFTVTAVAFKSRWFYHHQLYLFNIDPNLRIGQLSYCSFYKNISIFFSVDVAGKVLTSQMDEFSWSIFGGPRLADNWQQTHVCAYRRELIIRNSKRLIPGKCTQSSQINVYTSMSLKKRNLAC